MITSENYNIMQKPEDDNLYSDEVDEKMRTNIDFITSVAAQIVLEEKMWRWKIFAQIMIQI